MALKGMILASHGFAEQSKISLSILFTKMGIKTSLISDIYGLVNSWTDGDWGLSYAVVSHISKTLGSDYDFLIIPEGNKSIEKLKTNPHTKRILSHFIATNKPILAIGDGAQLFDLIDGFEKTPSQEALVSFQDSICFASYVDEFKSLESALPKFLKGEDLRLAA